MTVKLPRSLSTRSQLAKQSRQQTLQTIILKATDNPSWTHRQMATWIAHEYGIAVPTGYAWLSRARAQLENLDPTLPGNLMDAGDVPGPVPGLATDTVPVPNTARTATTDQTPGTPVPGTPAFPGRTPWSHRR